jgi:hypothetical protein
MAIPFWLCFQDRSPEAGWQTYPCDEVRESADERRSGTPIWLRHAFAISCADHPRCDEVLGEEIKDCAISCLS